jgi:hypothetical protein
MAIAGFWLLDAKSLAGLLLQSAHFLNSKCTEPSVKVHGLLLQSAQGSLLVLCYFKVHTRLSQDGNYFCSSCRQKLWRIVGCLSSCMRGE